MPSSQAPPSSTISAGPNSSLTCAAVVGLTCPKRFALGAARPAMPCLRAARKQRARHRMARAAQRQRRQARRRRAGAAWRAPHDHRHRPGPEGSDQALGGVAELGGERQRLVAAEHVHDQRVVGGPALGGEDLRDRGVIVGTRGQAVHGFGRHGDQAALRQQLRGLLDRLGTAMQTRCPSARPFTRPARPSRCAASRASVVGSGRAGRSQRSGAPSCARAAPGACRTGAGARRAAPARRPTRARATVAPQVAQQVEHHGTRMHARRGQRQARHRAHLPIELADIAGIDRAVARVVRPRRHLVGVRARRCESTKNSTHSTPT